MQVEIDVNQLLKDEVNQANLFMKRAREVLEPIYMSAATKLITNNIISDPSEICSRLCKIFGSEHERQLQRWLPEKYKRTYVKDEERDAPRNLREEYIKRLCDVHGEVHEALLTLYKIAREEPEDTEDYNTLIDIMTSQFRQLSELEKGIEDLNAISISLAHAKQVRDQRQKIGDYEKVMLKIQLLFINKDHVAKMIHFSSKWIKNGVEKDEEIQRALDVIRRCPFCMRDIADWYNQAKIAVDRGQAVDAPPILAKLT